MYFSADARDSIAKVAYGRVFGWIVSKVNELLAPNVDFDVELSEIGEFQGKLFKASNVIKFLNSSYVFFIASGDGQC